MDGFSEEPTLGRALGKGCRAEGTDEALEGVVPEELKAIQGMSRERKEEDLEAGLGRAYVADLGIWAPPRREGGGLGC